MAGQKKTLNEKKALLEEKEKKVRQALARLQKEKSRIAQDERKARNGELIAFGIYLEEYLKKNPARIPNFKKQMEKQLAGRNLERALAGLKRIEDIISALSAHTKPETDRVIAENEQEKASKLEKAGETPQETRQA